MTKRRSQWQEGAVVRIALGEAWYAYGRLRKEPTISIYDYRGLLKLEIDEVIRRPVLFSIWVMRHALKSWPTIGVRPLDAALTVSDSFVKRDMISGKVTIYTDGQELPADGHAMKHLEVAAVWDPEHVEERIRDHYEGRANKWVESLRASVTRTG